MDRYQKKKKKLEIIGQSAYQGFLYTDRSTKGLFQPFVSRFLKICYLLNFIFGANSFPNVFPDNCLIKKLLASVVTKSFQKLKENQQDKDIFFFSSENWSLLLREFSKNIKNPFQPIKHHFPSQEIWYNESMNTLWKSKPIT